MELDRINVDTESMKTLIRKLNELFDTIAVELNTLETGTEQVVAGEQSVSASQSVGVKVVGKNFKLGTTNLAKVKNNTMLVDKADLILKFKDKLGAVKILDGSESYIKSETDTLLAAKLDKSGGWSGTYVVAVGSTITVLNGQITNII